MNPAEPSLTRLASTPEGTMLPVFGEIKKLYAYRELLWSMVSRELKIRYKNSFLGFLWSLFNPLMTVFVISYLFKDVLRIATQNFSAYVLAAYLPYMFVSMAVMDATGSVLGNLGLVKKISFPREILPISIIISNFIHFVLALGVFFVYLLIIWLLHPGQLPFQATSIYLPLLLVINLLLVSGMGLMLSALNTFYEDVKYMIGFIMQMLLFLSPIMSLVEDMAYATPRRYIFFKLINPVGTLCNAYRKVLLAHQPVQIKQIDGVMVPGSHTMKNGMLEVPALPIEWGYIAYTGVLSVIIFFAGYAVFNRYKWKFVERP